VYSLIILVALSFALSTLMTPIVRYYCRRWALLDLPAARKVHQSPVPRAGGVAVVISCLLAYGILMTAGLRAGDLIWSARFDIFRLSIAAFLVFLVGLTDDIYSLRAMPKLAGEAVAALAAYLGGVRLESISGHALDPWIGLPLTVLWLLACTNALNLIDGLDGLACGIGLFATASMLLAALIQKNVGLALAVVPLFGALLGFLRFNFNPATIFLGDSGSLFIGFLLGCYGILWTQKSATLLGMTAPLMALAIPLLDTSLTVARRFLRNQPIFSPDRRHIHHRLLDRGFTPHDAVLALYACCGAAALCSLAVTNAHTAEAAVILFGALIWAGVNYLGYVEFGVLAQHLHPRTFSRTLAARMRIQELETTLSGASTVDECWVALRGAGQELGFSELTMRLDHTFYQERFGKPAADARHGWTIRIPISETEFVNFSQGFEGAVPGTVVAPLADALRRALEPKLHIFQCGVPAGAPVRVVRYGSTS